MKTGAHCYIFTDSWSDASLPILHEARALGLSCLEIAVGDDVDFTPALTRRRAEQLGLELVVSPGARWPVECDLSAADASWRARGLAWHKKQVDLAAELGAVAYTGALYGHTGMVERRPPLPEEYARIAEGLRDLAGYAQARGVDIVLEPMSHFRTHLVNKPEQAMQLIELCDHPNLAVLLDTYHMVTEVRDYAAAVHAAAPRLWGLHACENDRGAPGGGLIPWPALFAALQETGFDGYIILEAYNSSIPGFAWQRTMFHNVCPDAGQFVRQSLAFLGQWLPAPEPKG
jgi:D-psicose/D-tagatose/L-ribulose 3-epimerase